MNKNCKIIEIRGIRGLITAIFTLCCLITGFTIFPGFISMITWNAITPYVNGMPTMKLLHGVMLWLIIFLIWFAFNGKKHSLGLGFSRNLSEEEISELIETVKTENEEQQDAEFENEGDEKENK